LRAEAVDVGALFAQARGEAGKVAVGRYQTEAREPSGMQQIHGIDDQCDIRRVLALGVGKLLVRIDGVFLQDVGPGFELRR
jgi:hypothetical protein